MFLSRLVLAPRSLDVLRDLGSPRDLHRTLMRGFPQHDGDDARAAFGVLFRTEVTADGGDPPELLVQSSVEPDWGGLPVGYAVAAQTKPIGHVLDAAVVGRELRFRLVANPTLKSGKAFEGEEPPKHSRRYALKTDEERIAWLARRGEQHGFRLCPAADPAAVAVDVLPPIGDGGQRQHGGGRKSAIRVQPVLFEGRLEVTDVERFRDAIRSGVGPGKAYGCGLLSLKAG